MKNLLLFVLFSSITTFNFAQTGPGGIGTNDGTSTLEFWVDANSGVTDATPISVWTDLSGNGITNMIMGDPTLTSNALNNYSVINFDGSGDYISTSLDISGDAFPQLDIITVYNFIGTTGSVWGEDNGQFDRFLTDTDGVSGCANGLSNGTGCINNAALFPASIPVITNVQFSEDVSNGSAAIVNGATVATFTSNHETETSNLLDLASIGTGGWLLTGDIAEVLVFGTNLNVTQQIIIYNYLSAKYNIALDANDIYTQDDAANGNYDHDVAGIGRVDASTIHDDAQGTGMVRVLNPAGLDNDEFLIWGHNNGTPQATETTDIPVGVQARFDRVWRVNETNLSGSSVDVGGIDIRFDLSNLGAITTSDLRLLVDTNNDGNFSDETPISGATSLGGGIYQFAGVADIADNLRFTIGTINTSQTPLPIELLSFNANVINNEVVRLEWQTATETNNDFFTIERSRDGINWIELDKIAGAGNSSSVLNYESIDRAPHIGLSYYRLKPTDFDNTYEYVSSIVVNVKQNTTEVFVFPNPAQDEITIKGNEQELSHLTIFNTFGQNVTNRVKLFSNSDSNIQVDLSSLSNGIYFVKTRTTINKIYKHTPK